MVSNLRSGTVGLSPTDFSTLYRGEGNTALVISNLSGILTFGVSMVTLFARHDL